MLTNAKDIKSEAIRRLDFLKKVAKPHHGINFGAGNWIGRRGDKTIDPDLHE